MLTFNLKKEWFDKIKTGEKTHEYREVKPYWDKIIFKELNGGKIPKDKEEHDRLCWYFNDYFHLPEGYRFRDNYPLICFMNGMVSEEKKPRIYAKLISIHIIDGKNTDLKIDKPVYDIEFEVIK